MTSLFCRRHLETLPYVSCISVNSESVGEENGDGILQLASMCRDNVIIALTTSLAYAQVCQDSAYFQSFPLSFLNADLVPLIICK